MRVYGNMDMENEKGEGWECIFGFKMEFFFIDNEELLNSFYYGCDMIKFVFRKIILVFVWLRMVKISVRKVYYGSLG